MRTIVLTQQRGQNVCRNSPLDHYHTLLQIKINLLTGLTKSYRMIPREYYSLLLSMSLQQLKFF